MAGAFSDALAHLDTHVTADPFDGWACRTAFYDVSKAFGPGAKAADIYRMVNHCLHVMGLGCDPAPFVENVETKRSLGWAIESCFEALLIDKNGRNRESRQRGVDRVRALGAEMFVGTPVDLIPLLHVPLDLDQARDLIEPYLNYLEAQLAADPLAHIKLCWDAFEFPVPPFDTVLGDWLANLDQKRGTEDLQAIQRGMAFEALAERGRQKLSWENCEAKLLPQLSDPHPLVASAAARFLGHLYSQPEEMFVWSTPEPLPVIMDMLAGLSRHRRFVAGGFLHGMADDMNPFEVLRDDPALQGYDVDQWTLDVFAQVTPEPYLPSAQSFWFHVHEGYCFDPAFIDRMIDEGHLWEALMTATEMRERVGGMEPVLKRLVACSKPSIAKSAQLCLEHYYQEPD